MVVEVREPDLRAEAGGIPQGSPPRQAGEDRGTPRQGGERRDGGASPSQEDEAAREHTERHVQAGEGRGEDVSESAGR